MQKRVAMLLLLGAVVMAIAATGEPVKFIDQAKPEPALAAGPVRLTARAVKSTGQPAVFFDEEADRLRKEMETRDMHPGGDGPKGDLDATWLNNLINNPGTVTLRDVAIGNHLKGPTDDTMRVAVPQSAAPRNVYLHTLTSVSPLTWRTDIISAEGVPGGHGLTIGDVDLDGQNEIVWGGTSGATAPSLRWAKWNGSSWTVQTAWTAPNTYTYLSDIFVADANNDGVANELIFCVGTGVYQAVFNSAPNNWTVTQLWTSTVGLVYGVALGNWDPTTAGNEIAAVTYGQAVARIWWNPGTSTWDVVYGQWGIDLDFYDVACGDFDPNNPGDELAVNNGYLFATYGAIGEITFDGSTFTWTGLYLPATWGTFGEVAVGNFIDARVGVAAVGGSQPVRGVWWNGSAWVNEALYTTSGTSYGIAIGNVNPARSFNQEIAISTYGKTYELEQDPPPANDVGVTAVWHQAPYTAVQGESRLVTVRISNFGLNPQTSIPVYYNVGAGNVTETWSGTLAPGTTVDFTFGTPWVCGAPAPQPVTAATVLGGDGNPANDGIASFFDVFQSGTRVGQTFNATAFPPMGWTSQVLVNTMNWERTTTGSFPTCTPLEGAAMAQYRSFSASAGSQARMTSHGFDVGATPQKIRLRFFMYGDPGYSTPPYDRVFVELSNDSTSWMVIDSVVRYNPVAGWYQRDFDLGDFGAGTRLWVAFRAYSQYGNNMFVDSIRTWIDTPTAPVNDLAVTAVLSPTLGSTVSGRPPLSFTPTCRVQNLGLSQQSNFAVRCTIYGAGGAVRNAQEVIVPGPLGLGQTADVPFTSWTPSQMEVVTFAFRTVLGGDQNPANDQQQGDVTILQPRYTGYDAVSGATWIDSDTTGGPAYSWIDITATGTDVPLPSYDDAYASIPIGFDFSFFGNSYSDVYVATNGYLQFGSGSSSLSNLGIPTPGSPDNIICPMWDDLHCEGAGRVKYQLFGTEPNRYLVVSYDNIRYYGGGDLSLTFQVILYEGTGAAVVQYANVATGHPTRDNGISATLGIENADGSAGLQYCLNGVPVTERPAPGRAILYRTPIHDAGPVSYTVPVLNATYPVGTVLTPVAVVQNFGNVVENIPVTFTDLAHSWSDLQTVSGVAPGATGVATFNPTPALVAGYHSVTLVTSLPLDVNAANDQLNGGFLVMDAPVLESPVGTTVNLLRPLFQWANLAGTSDYDIDVDNNADFSSPEYSATGLLISEATPDVDLAEGHWYWRVRGQNGGLYGPYQGAEFDVAIIPPPTPGWYSRTPVLGGALVKDGGWLEHEGGIIYVAQGNKSSNFLAYYPGDGDSWQTRAPIPTGGGRLPKKGADGTGTGTGVLYATKGNNTQEFYKFDGTAWVDETPVPLGTTNKKVKGGNDMVYVDMVDSGFVYLLKGYKNEFYKYNTLQKTWTPLTNAPGEKYGPGSWLAFDGSQYIYAHQSKVNAMARFDITTDAWDPTPLTGMPLMGMMGRNKKSKDGGSAVYLDGAIYALKGGNTQEFWRFDVATGTWAERETIPAVAPGATKKKKVKGGGDITLCPDEGTFYAIKGNKSGELWMYQPGAFVFAAPRQTRDGVMAGSVTPVAHGLTVSPSPLAGGYATVRYSVPKAGAVSLGVYDVSGRLLLTRPLGHSATGALSIDLRSLSAGVYLVKLSGDGFSTSQKLVVER